MNTASQAINYILSFKPYVLLPAFLFVFSLIFRIPLSKAVKSCLTIGIGFIGIFNIFDYFVKNIGPAVQSLITRTGLHFNVLDVGWPPLAAMTWSYKLAPLLIVVVMVVNMIMLAFKLTKTINIDIWNYWHFMFIGELVYESTGNILLSLSSAVVSCAITLKLADWSVHAVKNFSGLSGVSISTLSGLAYYPLGVIGNMLLDRIPGINKIDANPDFIKKKLGILGEPIFIGFIMGSLLGIGSGYDIKKTLELGFDISAVILILPVMSGILSQGIIPISESMKDFISNKFSHAGETYIGLDLVVLLGNVSVIVTALLLMPVALLLAFILPGIKFIPLGDLANVMGAIVMVVVAARCNVMRSLIICIPILIGKLYAASYMAGIYTSFAHKVNFTFEGYNGIITSFLDGGNLFKFWMIKVFEGNWYALAFIPAVLGLLFITYKKRYSIN